MTDPESQSAAADSYFSEVQEALDEYLLLDAEVETVFDYRYGGKRLARQKLQSLYESHPLANEAVSVVPYMGCSRIIDYSSGLEDVYEGPVLGYMHKFYPVADIQNAANAGENPWEIDSNGLLIKVGIRIKPLFFPPNFNSETTYIEVLASEVETVTPALEMHPLQAESEIFEDTSYHLLNYGPKLGLDSDRITRRLTEVVGEHTELCQFTMCNLVIDVYPGTLAIHADSLSELRALLESEDEHSNLEISPFMPGRAREVRFLNFDWLPDEQSTSEAESASLYAVVELLDDFDVAQAGVTVVAIPVDGIRFGYHKELKSAIDRPTQVFAYEDMLFENTLQALQDENQQLSYRDVESATLRLLGFLNSMSINTKMQPKLDLAQSRTLHSTIVFNIDRYRELRGRLNNGEENEEAVVHLQDFQDVRGIIKGFMAQDISREEDEACLILLAVLDVSEDRYFRALGVDYLEVPIQQMKRAQIVLDSSPQFTSSVFKNLSGYIHAN